MNNIIRTFSECKYRSDELFRFIDLTVIARAIAQGDWAAVGEVARQCDATDGVDHVLWSLRHDEGARKVQAALEALFSHIVGEAGDGD